MKWAVRWDPRAQGAAGRISRELFRGERSIYRPRRGTPRHSEVVFGLASPGRTMRTAKKTLKLAFQITATLPSPCHAFCVLLMFMGMGRGCGLYMHLFPGIITTKLWLS
eukprot:scaffold348_cov329-Pavlova_lutheri.AAC.63